MHFRHGKECRGKTSATLHDIQRADTYTSDTLPDN